MSVVAFVDYKSKEQSNLVLVTIARFCSLALIPEGLTPFNQIPKESILAYFETKNATDVDWFLTQWQQNNKTTLQLVSYSGEAHQAA